MTITADTWAVVAATGLGPIIAVGITLAFTYWRETSGDKHKRRLDVFRTLMATRRAVISPEHVNAINLIEVDFYRCKNVDTSWKEYKRRLDDNKLPEDASWRNERDKRLSKLLFEMAKILNFEIPAIDIFEGGYAPGGLAFRDSRYVNMLEFIYELSKGKKSLPVSLHEKSKDP